MKIRPVLACGRGLLAPLLDLAFPPLCIACGAYIDDGENRLCRECQASLTILPLDHSVYAETLTKLTGSGSIGGLVSLYGFEKSGPLQSLVHSLKYGGTTSIGTNFGRLLGVHFMELNNVGSEDIIVPIPLHKARLRERGYNQAQVIGEGMSRACGIPVKPRVLERRRNTVSQTTLALQERKVNVAGAFSMRLKVGESLRGKRVLLVDDVITTGSTVVECGRILREQGTECIIACSIALAMRDS